jgi:hypothetical protein
VTERLKDIRLINHGEDLSAELTWEVNYLEQHRVDYIGGHEYVMMPSSRTYTEVRRFYTPQELQTFIEAYGLK